jgi:hypothetical protein
MRLRGCARLADGDVREGPHALAKCRRRASEKERSLCVRCVLRMERGVGKRLELRVLAQLSTEIASCAAAGRQRMESAGLPFWNQRIDGLFHSRTAPGAFLYGRPEFVQGVREMNRGLHRGV